MKKAMRLIVVMLIMAMMVTGFAACGSAEKAKDSTAQSQGSSTDGDAKSKQPREISFWMQKYGSDPAAQDKLLKDMTEEFEGKTGIKVKYSIVDWGQALNKYTLACTGGEAPDVADIFFTASLIKIGGDAYGPMEIDDVAKEMGEDSWFQAGKDEAYQNGHWYGIPWRFDTRVLLYNKDYFAEAGITAPPATWDEMVETGKKLTKTDAKGNITRAGLAWFNMMARFDQTWFALLGGAGGSLMDEGYTKPAFNTQAGLESLALMRDVNVKHKIAVPNMIDPSYDPVSEFMAGKVAMVFGVTAETKNNIENQAPQLKGKFASAVMPSKTGEGPSSIAFSAPIVVFKTTKDADASKEWVKYFCSTENQLKASKTLSLLNSSKAVMSDGYFSQDEWLNSFVKQSDRAVPGDIPVAPWSQIDAWPNGPLPTLCTEVIAGKDIQKSIDKAVVAFEKLMK